jgi:hypothetical protein
MLPLTGGEIEDLKYMDAVSRTRSGPAQPPKIVERHEFATIKLDTAHGLSCRPLPCQRTDAAYRIYADGVRVAIDDGSNRISCCFGACASWQRASLVCWGYMKAMQDLSVWVDENGNKILGTCPPERATTLDLIHSFVTYARSHPSQLQGNAALAVMRAFQETFPCDDKGAL